MNFFVEIFLECAAIIVGITIVSQILGKIFIKDLRDTDDRQEVSS
jgi:hypothetical protein